MADSAIHLRDAARALDLLGVKPGTARMASGVGLPDVQARPPARPADRLAGLRLTTTDQDQDWDWGMERRVAARARPWPWL
jgi:hypothetical protein